jgi:hypothetical protein
MTSTESSPPQTIGVIQRFRTVVMPKHIDYPVEMPHSNEDKLTQGPCSDVYATLSLCAHNKGEGKHEHHQGLCRNEMKACPEEAKKVVHCIAGNEGYFLNM